MKRYSVYLSSVLFLMFMGLTSDGQTEPPKEISGGVLNGKAASLPKPPYPPAARAVQASGAVTVQVLIDEFGNVVSATAVSGHPLLRAAAVSAAREAKFLPTTLQGRPVKVSGVITYNFVGPLSLASVGFELGFAESEKRFRPSVSPRSLSAQLPADMAGERELLAEFDAFLTEQTPSRIKAEPVKPGVDGNKSSEDRSLTSARSTERFTVMGSAAGREVNAGRELNETAASRLRSIIDQVESGLSQDPVRAWNFRLGRLLGAVHSGIADDGRLAESLYALDRHADLAPANVPRHVIDRTREIVGLGSTPGITEEMRTELKNTVAGLVKLSSY